MKVFIGYDPREDEAYRVAARSVARFGITPTPIYEDRLRMQGLLTRPVDRRAADGQRQTWDFESNAPQSTDFAVSRFFTGILAHSGYALFTDCDVVFLKDPRKLLLTADPDKAISVVQHPPLSGGGLKMDGQKQTAYARKNWSSVCLWNCDHPANRRLNVTTLNSWPGRDLHAFRWLADDEIGELAPAWNWLVGIQPKPATPCIAHFTLGGPWLPDWAPREHDEIWRLASEL